MQKFIDFMELVEVKLPFKSSGLLVSRSGRCFTSEGKERKPFNNGSGYLFIPVWIFGCGKNHQVYLHRLVATCFLGSPLNPKMQVNHKDGDKTNNALDNLEWVTPAKNIQHSDKTGLSAGRRRFGSVKFRSPKLMAKAYFMVKSGVGNITEVAKNLGMSRTTLSSVMNKRSHKKVTDLMDVFFI